MTEPAARRLTIRQLRCSALLSGGQSTEWRLWRVSYKAAQSGDDSK